GPEEFGPVVEDCAERYEQHPVLGVRRRPRFVRPTAQRRTDEVEPLVERVTGRLELPRDEDQVRLFGRAHQARRVEYHTVFRAERLAVAADGGRNRIPALGSAPELAEQ